MLEETHTYSHVIYILTKVLSKPLSCSLTCNNQDHCRALKLLELLGLLCIFEMYNVTETGHGEKVL